MSEQQKLPYRILKKAGTIFAGATGFSYAEMANFFSYELNKQPEEIKLPDIKNREDAFQKWLSFFSIPKQKLLLLKLCKDDLPMWHGKPEKEECEVLAKWISSFAIDETASSAFEHVNYETVSEYWTKALERRTSDPEGAITAARTLLESVCKHILEDASENYSPKDDLPKLYGQVAKIMNLAPSQHTEDSFKRILGGCFSVVEGLGAIRNTISDAHGKGRVAIKPASRHAALAVNLAGAMATFLMETWNAKRDGMLKR